MLGWNVPQCRETFKDAWHLMDEVVDKYLPIAAHMIATGHGRHLAVI